MQIYSLRRSNFLTFSFTSPSDSSRRERRLGLRVY
uniref:Uncharacterized protein MANES_08G152300 n=1 Tax=Rhizophora mucronata TaxID=61149 RepID=A0A2P2M7N8_RHIMU